MRYGSVCSGIGGLDLALEAVLEVEPAWLCESDPSARAVLERHWPGVPIYPDARSLGGVEAVDIIVGGYPCQPFSKAGRQRGEHDPRHLWPAIFDAVRVLRPRLVVCENVAAHLSLGFDRVLADLAGIGFDGEWSVVRASDVGAPHRRARLFFTAADSHRDRRVGRPARHRRLPRAPGADSRRAQERQRVRDAPAGRGAPPPDADRVAGPSTDPGGRRRLEVDDEGTLEGAERFRGMEGIDWAEYGPAIARWEPVVGRPAPVPTDAEGRLNVAFAEWMMGFPEGWVQGIERAQQLKCLGNAVVPQQGEFAIAELLARS